MIEYEAFEKRDISKIRIKELLQEIRQKLYEYFEFKKGERDYMFFLTEAFQMDFKRLKYISLKGLISQNLNSEITIWRRSCSFSPHLWGIRRRQMDTS